MKKENQQSYNWEKIAKLFHDTYEKQAPFFGYVARKKTRKFNPNSNNGKLMIEVVKRIIPKLFKSEKEKWQKELIRKTGDLLRDYEEKNWNNCKTEEEFVWLAQQYSFNKAIYKVLEILYEQIDGND